jgi:hypothetical protein
MLFCLDDEIDRKGTNSVKWEFFVKREGIPQLEYSDRSFGPDRIIWLKEPSMGYSVILHRLKPSMNPSWVGWRSGKVGRSRRIG